MIKISLAVGILLVIVAGIFVVAYDISAKAQYILKTRTELNSRLDAINQLALLKVSSAEAKPFVDKLNRALPPEDLLLTISGDMENAARRYNLGYTFKFVGAKRDISENLKAIDFQITAQGDYQSVRSFMRDMETLPYFISLLDADITAQRTNVYNSAIRGVIYFNG